MSRWWALFLWSSAFAALVGVLQVTSRALRAVDPIRKRDLAASLIDVVMLSIWAGLGSWLLAILAPDQVAAYPHLAGAFGAAIGLGGLQAVRATIIAMLERVFNIEIQSLKGEPDE